MDTQNKLNEIRVSYKLKTHYDIQIKDSNIANLIARRVYNESDANLELKEYFFIILLNRSNHIIGWYKISEGGLSGTIADVKMIYSIALKCLTTNIILVHNHPSGAIDPSAQDKQLTYQIKKAGELLDITVLDHIILTKEEFYSFADEGRL
jgi:DNA repair protein RadC